MYPTIFNHDRRPSQDSRSSCRDCEPIMVISSVLLVNPHCGDESKGNFERPTEQPFGSLLRIRKMPLLKSTLGYTTNRVHELEEDTVG